MLKISRIAALFIPMASCRKMIKPVFKNTKARTSPNGHGSAEVIKKPHDIVLVDEAHRLRKRTTPGSYFVRFDDICRELDRSSETTYDLEEVTLR